PGPSVESFLSEEDSAPRGIMHGAMPEPPESHTTLAFQLRTGRRMTPQEATVLIAEAAEDLQRLHDRGVVHGELEPSKILLDAGGHASLIRPDAAKSGGRNYTAPERLRDPDLSGDQAGDIYALGAILYELLTGQPPFGGPAHGLLEW